MAAQSGLCLAWTENPEDMFCRVVAHIQPKLTGSFELNLFRSSEISRIFLLVSMSYLIKTHLKYYVNHVVLEFILNTTEARQAQ